MSTERTYRSSTTRLSLTYGAIVLVLVVALQGTVYLVTRNALDREVRNVLSSELGNLADHFSSGGVVELTGVLQSRVDSWGRTGAVYLLTDASLHPLAGNLTAWPAEIAPQRTRGARFHIATINPGVSHPVQARVEHLPGNYWLLVGTDISESRSSLKRFGLATAWGVALITSLIAVLGWWYDRRAAQRVREFSRTCDSIVHNDLSGRLQIGRRSDEYDQLSSVVNNMLNRIEQQTVLLRTTFGSIAHDLRTPLYRLRVRLEAALLRPEVPGVAREIVAPAMEELDRVQRTLGTLLEIARAEAGGTTSEEESVDLAALAREMFELYQPGMQERGLTLVLDAAETAAISGKRQLLAQLIANLLENALKYVPSEGRVALRVSGDRDVVRLSVADNGPGIPERDREKAQKPFVRLDENAAMTAGSGLGLSLVRAIARLHRGELDLRDNAPGLVVECTFPRSAGVTSPVR